MVGIDTARHHVFRTLQFLLTHPSTMYQEARNDSFSNIFAYPAGIYMFKVSWRNTRKKVWNLSKVNNKDTTFLKSFYCWIWAGKCRLGTYYMDNPLRIQQTLFIIIKNLYPFYMKLLIYSAFLFSSKKVLCRTSKAWTHSKFCFYLCKIRDVRKSLISGKKFEWEN